MTGVSQEKQEERGGKIEERDFYLVSTKGKPEKPEGPREQMVPSQTNHLGSEKGYGFTDGIKPLKHSFKAEQVLR